jgi:hypothetical protein
VCAAREACHHHATRYALGAADSWGAQLKRSRVDGCNTSLT